MIPKPANVALSNFPIRKLREVYPGSFEQFRVLRAATRDADKRYLDQSESTVNQSPVQWEKFKREIVARFPEIEDFENYWPLFVMVSNHRRLERKSARNIKTRGTSGYKTGHRQIIKIRGSIQRKFGHRQMYVGSALPKRIAKSTLASSNHSDGAICIDPDEDDIIEESYPHVKPIPSSDQTAGTGHAAVTPSETVRSRQQTIDSDGSVQVSNTYPCNCDDTTSVAIVCENKKSLIDALALLGIKNDKHLLILNKLAEWGAGLAEFFDSLPADKLPVLYKVFVLSRISKCNALSDQSGHSSCRHDYQRLIPNEDSSPLLQALLQSFGLEELHPFFHAAHVTTDEEFLMLQGLDEPQRLAIFDGENLMHILPFQRWIIDFILRRIDMTG
ncbi:hypothetical protein J132_10735 [Termitomyces sp. J132]|nr:hypothetical protein H2248_011196 [Termitomyces sp. 'cryptogamus']KNZ79314.1 hypothetical protein J132_10735 [Termitomyces sp. J132]